MADYQYLSQGQDDGVIVNRLAEPLAFFAGTPAAQAAVTSAAITTPSTTTASYGSTTAAEFNALTATVQQIRAALVAYGLISEA